MTKKIHLRVTQSDYDALRRSFSSSNENNFSEFCRKKISGSDEVLAVSEVIELVRKVAADKKIEHLFGELTISANKIISIDASRKQNVEGLLACLSDLRKELERENWLSNRFKEGAI